MERQVRAPVPRTGGRGWAEILATRTPKFIFPSVWRSWIRLLILLQLPEAGRWWLLPWLFTDEETGPHCHVASGVSPPRRVRRLPTLYHRI